MIKEVIVVEGRDDISAVKRAVNAEVIATHGLGITDEIIDRIKLVAQKRGIIVFTDPDYPGEKIRKIISTEVKNCKHAFLPKDKAIKDGDVGIENAKPEDIIEALNKARVEKITPNSEFSKVDMLKYGLVGTESSSRKRDVLGRVLGIGYCNSKQFLKRLNNYGITREEFEEATRSVLKEYE